MDGIGGTAREHRRAIERKNTHALEGKSGAMKQIDCQKISTARLRIIPQRELWVIAYPSWVSGIMLNRVEGPGASHGVGALRHTDALIEWPIARNPGKSEIAHHPAIGHLIVENKNVSEVLVAAARRARQWGKERVECDRARERVAVFVENLERTVDPFDVMIRADIAICVRRETTAATLRRVHAIKCQQRRRHCGRWLEDVFK